MKLVRSLIGIGMCAMVSLVGSNTVFAQTAQTTERLAALESRTDADGEKNGWAGDMEDLRLSDLRGCASIIYAEFQ